MTVGTCTGAGAAGGRCSLKLMTMNFQGDPRVSPATSDAVEHMRPDWRAGLGRGGFQQAGKQGELDLCAGSGSEAAARKDGPGGAGGTTKQEEKESEASGEAEGYCCHGDMRADELRRELQSKRDA